MGGLRGILRRRADRARVAVPGPHAFRRAFALLSLRQGIDTISLQRLMGHSDQSVLQRYLKQDKLDLQIAHRRAGLLDRLL
jgi:integrase